MAYPKFSEITSAFAPGCFGDWLLPGALWAHP